MVRMIALLAVLLAAASAQSEERRFSLLVSESFAASGAAKHILPRFSLKTGVRIDLVESGGDAALGPEVGGAGAFVEIQSGAVYRLAIPDGPKAALAGRFRDWIGSEVGGRAVESFAIDGAPVFARLDAAPAEEVAAAAAGDKDRGAELALRVCGRCHVVDARNRFGGIGSTPSFGAMKNLPRWRDRFEAFWTLNPHPAFTQVADVTEPFDPQRPPPIAPVELTLDDVEAIVAFVVALPVKDLGGALVEQ